MSQQELADKSGISQAVISYLENGVIKCGITSIAQIATCLAFPHKPMQLLDMCSVEQWEKTA